MTLRQALQMPGVYGRVVKPWDPEGPAADPFRDGQSLCGQDHRGLGQDAPAVGLSGGAPTG